MSHLFCFGFGYAARALAWRLAPRGWRVTGTCREEADAQRIEADGFHAVKFDGLSVLAAPALESVSHVLVSVPPDELGDPVLRWCSGALMQQSQSIAWVGYLSTTGVYGDKGGDWVDEMAPLAPNTERGRRRVVAETAWAATGLPVHIFRLAGIYGPGRNQLVSVLDGTAKRIVKPGQVFSRIHVDDIAGVLAASIAAPGPGQAYNVCDDEPCPPQDVVAYAAQLLGRPVPLEIPFEEAALSPMARSFYADSKRVSNRKVKQSLGYELIYPTYREGLSALYADMARSGR